MAPADEAADRPPAPAEHERGIREAFPFQRMSPEEYAAREAADIACFSLDQYRYSDPKLDAWIRRLGAILSDWKLVNECRKEFLSPEEMQRALERDQEEF
jgi:hypothetical protein